MSHRIAPSVARKFLACLVLSFSLVACAGRDTPRSFEVAPVAAAETAPVHTPVVARPRLPSAFSARPAAQPVNFTPMPAAGSPAAPISECQANFEERMADAVRAIERRRI